MDHSFIARVHNVGILLYCKAPGPHYLVHDFGIRDGYYPRTHHDDKTMRDAPYITETQIKMCQDNGLSREVIEIRTGCCSVLGVNFSQFPDAVLEEIYALFGI